MCVCDMKLTDTCVVFESLTMKSTMQRNLKCKAPSVRSLGKPSLNNLKIQLIMLNRYQKSWSKLNGSQLAKMKSTFLTCHCHEIYREEAVALKNSNYTLKIMKYMEFGVISLKIDIL